jgi:glutaredoxin
MIAKNKSIYPALSVVVISFLPVLAQAQTPPPAAPAQLQTQTQQIYRWLDKDGKVVYSDQPPPADAKQPQTKRLGASGGAGANNEELSYAAAEAARKNPVTLFVNNCGEPCDNARKILSERGVPHSTKNPELTKEVGDELKRLSGSMSVPFMVIGEAAMRGFEENAWNLALDNAGYPRPGLLTKKTKAKEIAPPPAPTPAAAPAASAPNT